MSPAKRLSRQRFRALCERCAKWSRYPDAPKQRRCDRFTMSLYDAAKRAGADRPFACAYRTLTRLARLAR